jgi:hypothetical protein
MVSNPDTPTTKLTARQNDKVIKNLTLAKNGHEYVE